MKTKEEMEKAKATYSRMPTYSGDGYGYGGAFIVTIGDVSINFGEDHVSGKLAEEVVRRWNALANKTD
jgi:hypothetical protein